MSEKLTILAEILKKSGNSITTPRKLVFINLSEHGPITMNALVKHLGNTVDRASVYRTVSLFEDLGIIQRLQLGWKHKLELSDQFIEHHHHMNCIKCGSLVATADNEELEKNLHALANPTGFQILSHQVELRGICKSCQNSRTPAV